MIHGSVLSERGIADFGTAAKSADNLALLHTIDARAAEGNLAPLVREQSRCSVKLWAHL